MRVRQLPARQRRCPALVDARPEAAEKATAASQRQQAALPRHAALRARRPIPADARTRSRCLRRTAPACACSLQPRLSEQQHTIAAAEAKGIAERVTHVALAVLELNLRSAGGIQLL